MSIGQADTVKRDARARRAAALTAGAALAAACVGDVATDPATGTPSVALGRVVVSPPTAIMAVGATQQLSVELFSLTGEPLADVDSVRYYLPVLSDTARIAVDAVTGVVTARTVTLGPALVNAFAFKDGAIKGDQALVQVTATALSGLTLSVQPVAPDSAKLAFGEYKTIVPRLWNPTTGEAVESPAVQYEAREEDVRLVHVYYPELVTPPPVSFLAQGSVDRRAAPNQIVPRATKGAAWIYARINAYGTELRDSVQYAFTPPYEGSIGVRRQSLALSNSQGDAPLEYSAPATITFQFADYGAYYASGTFSDTTLAMDFTFSDSTAALPATPPSDLGGESGNVRGLKGGRWDTSQRRFTKPGTYRWTGTVIGPAPFGGRSVTGQFIIH